LILRILKTLGPFFFLALTGWPIYCHAGWVQVGIGKDVALYLDPEKTVALDSLSKRAVILLSFAGKQQVGKSEPYYSVVSRIEADCRQMSYKTIANFYYAQTMGKGEIASTSNIALQDQEVRYPAPNSALDDALTQICSKK
jgi:hypothetical protein